MRSRIINTEFNNSLMDELFGELFYNLPKEPKPPFVQSYLYDKGSEERATHTVLQLALAGMTEEDVKVYSKKNKLFIEGDNIGRDGIASKFTNSFSWSIPVSDHLDLSKCSAEMKDGLLTITIPLVDPKDDCHYILGKQ